MSTTSAIHFYYQNQPLTDIEYFLKQHGTPYQQIFVFIPQQAVSFAEASVPVTFTAEDILQFIKIEQAKLFPVLNENIYIDFLIKDIQECEQVILIAACNFSDYSDLKEIIHALKLDWMRLCIDVDDYDYKNINLLPWRERLKNERYKKQRKFFYAFLIALSFIMLVVSLFFVRMSHFDHINENKISHKITRLMQNLKNIEHVNNVYRQLIQGWKMRVENAHQQSEVSALLRIIEVQRPGNLIIEALKWQKNNLILQGKSKERFLVKQYLENLQKNHVRTKLKFISNKEENDFPWQFEIEIRMEKT